MGDATTGAEGAIDPHGVLAHLVEEISVHGTQVLNAEQLLIRLLTDSAERGATADQVAAELSLSRTDAETLLAGESMLKRRFSEL